MNNPCNVDILLSTYNGAEFLSELLDSIIRQTYNSWRLIIRDDGSTDTTNEIVKKYISSDNRITLHQDSLGNIGPCQSFAKLMIHSNADYIMFCDQDDIWLEDKIKRMLKETIQFEQIYPGVPILAVSDLSIINENGSKINPSFWLRQKVDPFKGIELRSLIVQNIFPGCSMLFNKNLLNLALPISDKAIMHDWWIALIASVFGKILIINKPLIQYRQHQTNVIGLYPQSISINILNSIKRISINYEQAKSNLNKFGKTINQSKAFLQKYNDLLSGRHRSMLVDFSNYSISCLLKYKVTYQPKFYNIYLFGSFFLLKFKKHSYS
jgi:glycosyltransferase involved in cell wall biosynthesis